MNGRQLQRERLMRCGDRYGFGLWLSEMRPDLKEVDSATAWVKYRAWLSTQPPCGHKKCAASRAKEVQP